jgi:hypothetical protein
MPKTEMWSEYGCIASMRHVGNAEDTRVRIKGAHDEFVANVSKESREGALS